MLNLPPSTAYGKRIPKQKFYENLDVTPELKRVFVEQIAQITWRNKLAASTLNVAAGEVVTELEVFEVKLNQPTLATVFAAHRPFRSYHILYCSRLRAGAGVDCLKEARRFVECFTVNATPYRVVAEDALPRRVRG